MSPLKPRLTLCAFATMLLAMYGCGVSTTPSETADSDTGAVDAATAELGSTEAPVAGESAVEEPMAEEPAAEEPTELAAVTPVEPEPTVPAQPESPEPEQPEEGLSLGIGDAAPALAIDQWVMGEPISQLQDGQVYVVEFWATWCPPCRTSMPHLSTLQEQYGEDVQFVGVTREDVDTVQGFLGEEQSAGKTWNEVVTYRLATDAGGVTNAAYMEAAGQGGIPTAFIVGRDGVVEWIGHPMSMDEPLAKIVAGDWDRAAAIAEFEQEQMMDELRNGLNGFLRTEKYDEALALIDEFVAEHGGSSTLTSYKMTVLQFAGRTEELAGLQAEMVEQAWDDSNALNEFAWAIAIGRTDGDLELAQRAAERAAELAPENGSVLDTLARVYYQQGDLEKAVEWQRKAVEFGSGNPTFAATLEQFETELAASQNKPEEPASNEEGEASPEEGEASPEAETDAEPSSEESASDSDEGAE